MAHDFFPPESAHVIMELNKYRRRFATKWKKSEYEIEEELQGTATILFASIEAHKILERKRNFAIVKKNANKHQGRKKQSGYGYITKSDDEHWSDKD